MTTPFLTVANVRFIAQQVNKLLNARINSKDQDVVRAVKDIAIAEIREHITTDEAILTAVGNIQDRIDADLFLDSLKAYTIPFKAVSEKGLQKLFRKDKKLKLPHLESIDWQSISYLSWRDPGTHRQYIVIDEDGQFKALRGVTDPQHATKGICAICQQHTNVHLFTATVKRNADSFTSYSNYICDDVEKCNAKLTDYEKLVSFIDRNLV